VSFIDSLNFKIYKDRVMAKSNQEKKNRLLGAYITAKELDQAIMERVTGTSVLEKKQEYISLLKEFLTSPAISVAFKKELTTFYRTTPDHLLREERFPFFARSNQPTASMKKVYDLLNEHEPLTYNRSSPGSM